MLVLALGTCIYMGNTITICATINAIMRINLLLQIREWLATCMVNVATILTN